jgi:hypothetical protein
LVYTRDNIHAWSRFWMVFILASTGMNLLQNNWELQFSAESCYKFYIVSFFNRDISNIKGPHGQIPLFATKLLDTLGPTQIFSLISHHIYNFSRTPKCLKETFNMPYFLLSGKEYKMLSFAFSLERNTMYYWSSPEFCTRLPLLWFALYNNKKLWPIVF